jgi:hypothetical protein
LLQGAPFRSELRIVSVWVNPLIAASNVIRYNLVGYVFRQSIGAEAEGTTSAQLFGFWSDTLTPNDVFYDAMIRMTNDLAKPLLVPLSVRAAKLFRNRPWVRILFQIYTVTSGTFQNYLIEGTPSSIYESALSLSSSLQ